MKYADSVIRRVLLSRRGHSVRVASQAGWHTVHRFTAFDLSVRGIVHPNWWVLAGSEFERQRTAPTAGLRSNPSSALGDHDAALGSSGPNSLSGVEGNRYSASL